MGADINYYFLSLCMRETERRNSVGKGEWNTHSSGAWWGVCQAASITACVCGCAYLCECACNIQHSVEPVQRYQVLRAENLPKRTTTAHLQLELSPKIVRRVVYFVRVCVYERDCISSHSLHNFETEFLASHMTSAPRGIAAHSSHNDVSNYPSWKGLLCFWRHKSPLLGSVVATHHLTPHRVCTQETCQQFSSSESSAGF